MTSMPTFRKKRPSPVATETTLPIISDSEAPGEWIAVHVFYSSNNHPLLVDVIGPFIEQLRAEGLLDRWFFIRYWMEGPHLRIRLRARRAGDTHAIAHRLFSLLDEFLEDRPALYEVDDTENAELFKQMFLGEYSEEKWDELYGSEGTMGLRPNNSYVVRRYEPAIDRYGGPKAIDVAEWHFEHSSDTVIRLESTANVHVRPVLFGLASQLMIAMLGVFLGDRDDAATFLATYRQYWERSSSDNPDERHEAYDKAYRTGSEDILAHLGPVFEAAVAQRPESLTGFVRTWTEHCIELRSKLADLDAEGGVEFPIGSDEPTRVDFRTGLIALLSGYIHMTNNRLGVSIIDECYLSYLLECALNGGSPVSHVDDGSFMFGGTGEDR